MVKIKRNLTEESPVCGGQELRLHLVRRAKQHNKIWTVSNLDGTKGGRRAEKNQRGLECLGVRPKEL